MTAWVYLVIWFFCLLLAGAGSAMHSVAQAARDLRSEFFNTETARINLLSFWGRVLSAIGVAASVGVAALVVVGVGYSAWEVAIAAGATVLIANYIQKISVDMTRARYTQFASPLLGDEPMNAAEESVDQVVDAAEKAGLIEMDEHRMIAGIVRLDRTLVRDIMVPRTDVVALDVRQSLADALDVIIKHAVSRVPVYQGTMDHIVGVLYAKDLLSALRDGKTDLPLKSLVRSPQFVPELQHVDELLQELQKTKVHFAIVVDEYGGTAGIVTIEDILEEIVGEIQDEYDTSEEPLAQKISETESLFNARATIDEVNEKMILNLPNESDTLGGVVLLHLEKMPKVGEQVHVNGVTLTVTTMAGRRIKQVRVTKGDAPPVKKIAR